MQPLCKQEGEQISRWGWSHHLEGSHDALQIGWQLGCRCRRAHCQALALQWMWKHSSASAQPFTLSACLKQRPARSQPPHACIVLTLERPQPATRQAGSCNGGLAAGRPPLAHEVFNLIVHPADCAEQAPSTAVFMSATCVSAQLRMSTTGVDALDNAENSHQT